jgi:hypothetical protein
MINNEAEAVQDPIGAELSVAEGAEVNETRSVAAVRTA